MANLVTAAQFIGDINLPGQVLSGSYATIDSYITKYEKDALIDLLGYDLYKELKAEIDSVPQVFTAKWSALVNGAEFLIGTYLYKFDGLADMVAYYVYFNYLNDNVNNYESVGAVIPAGENSTRTAPDGLMVASWNNYKRRFDVAIQYIIANQSLYPKWITNRPKSINSFGI
jgi:hypothetical protein